MATGFTDWTEYDIDEDPVSGATGDWTLEYGSAGTRTVVANADMPGGRMFRWWSNQTEGGAVITWDATPTDTDYETLVLLRREDTTSNGNFSGTVVQFASDTGYAGTMRNNLTEHSLWRIPSAGSITNIAHGTHGANDPDDWNWQRCRRNGSDLLLKTWPFDPLAEDFGMGDEPASWQMSETDSTYTGAGRAGLLVHRGGVASNRNYEFGWFGWATDGDTAPGPASADPEPPWSLTVNTSGNGTVVVEDDGTPVDPTTHDWDDEDVATLTATPDSGWELADPLWTGQVPSGDVNDNPLSLVMDQDRTVTANFVESDPPPPPPEGTFRRVRFDGQWFPQAEA